MTDSGGSFFSEKILPGKHVFRFEKQGYVTQELTQEVSDLTSNISVTLAALPIEPLVPSGTPASLFLDTNVGDAAVYIDGQIYGHTGGDGKLLIETTSGVHSLRIEKDGYQQIDETFSASSDLTNNKTVVLQAVSQKAAEDPLIKILIGILLLSVVIAGFVIFKVFGSSGIAHTRFDQYMILSLIGRGGMASIYRARDMASKAHVALKIMDESYLNDKDLVEKFFLEGKVISEINEEYPQAPVVKVFRFGREGGRTWGSPFIAMELLRGPNLLQFIKTNRNLHPQFILKVLKQVGEALQAAHRKGVFHRDITPDNIVLIKSDPLDPVIRLIDFGVARHEYIAAGTLDGSIAGKPPYMSPEQCRGEKVDGRSDIYSLGIVFYTLLTGSPPFVSNNPLEVMTHHQHTPVPPLPGRISPQISQVVLKMLKKDRNDRYDSVNYLIKDISRLLQEAS